MFYQAGDVSRVESVQYVEEVLTAWITALRQDIGEVLLELCVRLKLVLKVYHTELIELWYLNEVNVFERHQLLLIGENHLEKVPVDHGIRRDV